MSFGGIVEFCPLVPSPNDEVGEEHRYGRTVGESPTLKAVATCKGSEPALIPPA